MGSNPISATHSRSGLLSLSFSSLLYNGDKMAFSPRLAVRLRNNVLMVPRLSLAQRSPQSVLKTKLRQQTSILVANLSMWKARDPGDDPVFDFQIKKLGTESGSNLPKVIQRVNINIEIQPGAASGFQVVVLESEWF